MESDFFTTPPQITRELLANMDLGTADYSWLEPSAGTGAMVKVLLEEGWPASSIHAVDKSATNCKALRALGVKATHEDFLELDIFTNPRYDRVIMFPPYEDDRDTLHVLKAYTMLAPGGVIGAIMREHVFYCQSTLAKEFREFLARNCALVISPSRDNTLPWTRFVIIHKKAENVYR